MDTGVEVQARLISIYIGLCNIQYGDDMLSTDQSQVIRRSEFVVENDIESYGGEMKSHKFIALDDRL